MAKTIDKYYIQTLYTNVQSEGTPEDYYTSGVKQMMLWNVLKK